MTNRSGLNKPYNWRDEEVDTYTKNRIDECRAEPDPEPEPKSKPVLWAEDYPDSVDYKCGQCGRAKPCRRHRY